MSNYMDRLSKVRDRLKKEDNLSVSDILRMDMYEYYKDLNERATRILNKEDEQRSNTKTN